MIFAHVIWLSMNNLKQKNLNNFFQNRGRNTQVNRLKNERNITTLLATLLSVVSFLDSKSDLTFASSCKGGQILGMILIGILFGWTFMEEDALLWVQFGMLMVCSPCFSQSCNRVFGSGHVSIDPGYLLDELPCRNETQNWTWLSSIKYVRFHSIQLQLLNIIRFQFIFSE